MARHENGGDKQREGNKSRGLNKGILEHMAR